jgi:hypothetical protein
MEMLLDTMLGYSGCDELIATSDMPGHQQLSPPHSISSHHRRLMQDQVHINHLWIADWHIVAASRPSSDQGNVSMMSHN